MRNSLAHVPHFPALDRKVPELHSPHHKQIRDNNIVSVAGMKKPCCAGPDQKSLEINGIIVSSHFLRLEDEPDVPKPLKECICDSLRGWLLNIYIEREYKIWSRLHYRIFKGYAQMWHYVARNNGQWERKIEGHKRSATVPKLIIYLRGRKWEPFWVARTHTAHRRCLPFGSSINKINFPFTYLTFFPKTIDGMDFI